MSRRERHFQDTEEKQQDKITKKKKESEFKKSPQRKTLESGKVLPFQKKKKEVDIAINTDGYTYKCFWGSRLF